MPYKHLYKIGNNKIVDLIHRQLVQVFGAENVIFCLPEENENDLLANYINSVGLRVARGSHENVLERLQTACGDARHEWVARVNGDNVIILQDMMKKAISLTSRSDVDVITNVRPRSYPKGCSIELVRRRIFMEIDSSVLTSTQCEHVFPYIYEMIPAGKLVNLSIPSDYSDLDVSCDDFRQLALLRYLFQDGPESWYEQDLLKIKEKCQLFESSFPFVGKSGVFTIAEVGGNHEGDFGYAKELVSQACATNVDAVKLQVYSPDLLVNQKVDQSRYEHFSRFTLTRTQYDELFTIIRQSGKKVSASVWSIFELKAFIHCLDFVKIGSGDLTDSLILDAIRDSGKPIILSTGLSTMAEIEWAMDRLDYRTKQSRIGVLQCTSMYPIPDIDSNLLVIQALQQRFGCVVGYSDHTVGYKALELAAAVGARIQEFHFTDSREGKTFRDHLVSLTPVETNQLIERNIKTMTFLGAANKEPALSEIVAGHTLTFRKGLFLNKYMAKGQTVTSDDLIALRPEAGISASKADELVGRVLARDVQRLEPLDHACFLLNRGN